MPLSAGTRLGPYEVLALIGTGGMGEVYRSRDTRLDRTVAIKVLPAQVAPDPSRRARFEREARTVSALTHPSICTLFDVGEHDGLAFLVMEYLAGETLTGRIARGPLPLAQAVDHAIAIASALDAAHQQGIVHRDLKPGNVMLTKSGVKLLDFGLAKIAGREPVAPLTSAATTADPLTGEGTIVGTLQYMAPEQLQGHPVDARADLWALGAILYEMVTGRRAFEGANAASLIAAILERDPEPLTVLQPLAAPALDRVVRRCLAKQPDDRWYSAHDLADELRWISQSGAEAKVAGGWGSLRGGRSRAVSGWTVALGAGVLLIGAGAVAWRWSRTPDAASRAAAGRLVLLASSDNPVEEPALSADGKMIAVIAEENGQTDLFVSRVAGGARVRLTNDATHERTPEFSPDGDQLAFVRRADAAQAPDVLVVPTLGGQAIVVAHGATAPAWSPDGRQLAVVSKPRDRSQELMIVTVDGTAARVVLRADANYPFLRSTAWSPDGKQLALVRSSGGVAGEVWVVPAAGGAPTRVSRDPPGVFSQQPRFTPDGRGIIHSSNRGGSRNLWLLPLDGSPATRLTSGPGPDLSPSVALDGSIAFLNEKWRSKLMVCDLATGASRTILTHPSPLWAPAVSPDGKELAYSQAEADGRWHIWTVPVEGGTPRQLTSGPVPEVYPRFTPDGRGIVYCSWAPGANRVWLVARAGGPPRAVSEAGANADQYADVSPDGRRVALVRTEQGTSHIYLVSLDGRHPPRQLVASPATLPRWSPDGRWIVFTRDRGTESGIFLVSAEGGEVRQLTQTGGWPVWWPDSRHLGFLVIGADERQQIWVLPVDGGETSRLSAIRYNGSNEPFDVSRDGRWLVTTDATRVLSEIWLLRPHR